jgi:hypothetical protein
MITDDTGTEEPHRLAIYTAWTDERSPGQTLMSAPILELSYGLADRLELDFEGSWMLLRRDATGARAGLGDNQMGVKWRFVDGGQNGLSLSTAPVVNFLTPGSHSDRRGLANPGTSWFLPFQAQKDLGPIQLDADAGYEYGRAPDQRIWRAGFCVGRHVTDTWELDAEVHGNWSDRFGRSEAIANVGGRLTLSKTTTLLMAVGRDLSNSLGPRVSLLTYLGFEIDL